MVLPGERPRAVRISNGSEFALTEPMAAVAAAFVNPREPASVLGGLTRSAPGFDIASLQRCLQALVARDAIINAPMRLLPPRTGLFDALRVTLAQALAFDPGAVVVTGMPYDVATSVRSGARGGPAALRDASPELFAFDERTRRGYFDPVTGRMELDGIAIVDIGDLCGAVEARNGPCFDRLERVTHLVASSGKFPLTLGGDHSIALAAVQGVAAARGPIGVLQIDAHTDIATPRLDAEVFEDWRSSCHHGTFMSWVEANDRVEHVVQVGVRQRTAFALEASPKVVTFPGTAASDAHVLAAMPDDVPWYITFDVDALDPSVVAGTGTPLPGGFLSNQLGALLRTVASEREIVGLDVCELIPSGDVGEALTIAELVLSTIGAALTSR